ncbi:hypothetical protein CLV40_10993 [Actinokineospora auranticolor]|uniref:Uncharacterized protein n=1 Tax=Actinokineospora auranticolor TaxID=155976 RepID=A0A2S6GNA6_9PSEU|nr:hypothetical protein CLV40_10993 [Actinokineospora auranticolor]
MGRAAGLAGTAGLLAFTLTHTWPPLPHEAYATVVCFPL